jgi:glycosyltransferase involved in cell wall biosynthesis
MTNVAEIPQIVSAFKSCPRPKTLLVFSDDWGRHPSSCQHLIRRLQGRYHILWVNTIGMRPPSWGWSTLTRGLEKVRHWTKSRPVSNTVSVDNADNVHVVNPKMWPWFRRRHDRALNRWLLVSQLQKALAGQPKPVMAVTTLPIVADLMGELPVDRWIYYCVDDFSTWPGLDQKTLAFMEADVIRKADVLVAASAVLQHRLEQSRDRVSLLTHGVDLEHWSRADVVKHPALANLERPIVTFWGLVDRRMDLAFLDALSRQLKQGTIVLVGPEDQPDSALGAIPHLQRIPALPYEELPQIAAGTDALILPYRDAPVTEAMQPLKLLEYLATGKPVIARDLPATRFWADSLDLADTAPTFADKVTERLETGLLPEQRIARERLSQESWDARAAEFEALLLS